MARTKPAGGRQVARPEGAAVTAAKAEVVERGKPLANPVPGDDGKALERIVASFRDRFPAKWEELALCPLQHGVVGMAELLKGKG